MDKLDKNSYFCKLENNLQSILYVENLLKRYFGQCCNVDFCPK